ncbi:flagellar basal-body MS-ring/collar protein FliF [Maricaulis sp.]|uniref:flagellar basal-body MS-ring/collar protein FliF n=1 Tax=Maricaulis sp. TaxID=1486257 RepID=UPI0026325B00|nr:flagellar basal-body MS-ring/collar protein FliF [Maricaulis sp.]
MNGLLQQLSAFGVGRLAAIFGLAAGVAAALVYFSSAVGGGSQALLYAGLDPAEAVATGQVLDQANIPYEIREGGTALYVARDQVDEARVRIATGGPITGASVGYEIFDQQDSFGQTSFVQNINAKRALEGELARTIQSLNYVSSARVHLNLPERRLFVRDQIDPTGAVTISTRGTLNSEQIRVIRNLVASGAGLDANNVSIADDRGRLLASASDDETGTSLAMDERQASIEAQLRQNILDIVEGVVGAGAARVQVTAELDRQRIEENSQTFDPEGAVLASRQRSEESSSDTDGNNRNAVSASENLPDNGTEGENGPTSESNRQVSNETVNFSISSTRRQQVTEAGAIRRLSVAVAVDGILETLEDGTTQWSARPDEQIAQIEALVRSAMGFVDEPGVRQDTLTVSQMEFARADPLLGTAAAGGFSFNKNDLMRGAEILVMFITAMLIIFLVARPLVKGAGSTPMPQGLALAGAGAGGGGAMLDTPNAPTALPSAAADIPAALPGGDGMGSASSMIDIEKIDGQVKASSIKKVVGIVEAHPEESISILRSWLHET